jgi:hypothetical protein
MMKNDYYIWTEQGPEFQSFMNMALELDSMLVNHDAFSLSDIIYRFIIEDKKSRQYKI